MKVLACPQCGALIGDFSERQKIVECEYCSSKIIIPREQIFDLSRKEVQKSQKIQEKEFKNKNIYKTGNTIFWKSPFSKDFS